MKKAIGIGFGVIVVAVIAFVGGGIVSSVVGGATEVGSNMLNKFQLFGAASIGIFVISGGMLGMISCVIPLIAAGVIFNQLATGVARYQAVQGRNTRLAKPGMAPDVPPTTAATATEAAATAAAQSVATHDADLAAERDAEASESALNSIIADNARDPLDAALAGADMDDPEFAGLMAAGSF